jgi:DNA topoisomerase-1
MENAKIEKTVIEIGNESLPQHFEARRSYYFDGFLKAYGIVKTEDDDDENNEKLLPKVKVGEVLTIKQLQLPKNLQDRVRDIQKQDW